MNNIEKYYRCQKEYTTDNDIIFQAISWRDKDIELEDDLDNKKYMIYLSGVTKDDQSVVVRIHDFISYYYIRIPDNMNRMWGIDQTNILYNVLRRKVGDGLVSRTLVEKIPIYPFVNGDKNKYIRLCFSNYETYRKCKNKFYNPIRVPGVSNEPIKFQLYESNVDPLLRFMHIKDIRPCGWIYIKKNEYTIDNNIIDINWKNVNPYIIDNNECDDIAPFRILTWDIECQSSRGFPEFPDASIDGDFISQIGVGFKIFNTDITFKAVFTCLKSNEVSDGYLINCNSEKDMLIKFINLIKNLDIDIISGYNTWGFDDQYLLIRLNKYNLDYLLDSISRIDDWSASLDNKNFSSGACGYNEFNIFSIPGVETLDMIQAIRRDHKLDSYKLGYVGVHFEIDKGKEDLPYKELFNILDKGNESPEEMRKVCEYCMQDAYLVLSLIEKLCILPNYIEMSKSTRVPINWLLTKGQQCKVFSQLAYEARKKNFVIPFFSKNDDDEDEDEKKIKGATVLTARRGSYFDQPVAGLDFKSLYPSIMIAYNLCYSTIVEDEKYLNIPGIEYETISWEQEEKDGTISKFTYTFVQNIKGILPGILERLWNDRNEAKREMKKYGSIVKKINSIEEEGGNITQEEYNERLFSMFRVMVLNGKQLAIKVTMNSVYGFTGASRGMFPLKPIAASVTAKGREMIKQTSKLAEEMYECITTYGDSVPYYQKVKIQKDNKEIDIEIGKLYDEYSNIVPVIEYINGGRDKEQLLVGENNIRAWTHKGWKTLRRVIRHKTRKRLYKITTTHGEVVVTEDHSLIDINGNQIKAEDMIVGKTLIAINKNI